MSKKIVIIFGITELVMGVLLLIQYNQYQEMKTDLLREYIISQHSIKDFLINAMEHKELLTFLLN